jgi:small subunit ribosomal protein S20
VAKRSKSGLKHKRQAAKRRVHNQSVLSRLKTLSKTALTNPAALEATVAELDRAARKGLIHKNTAARKKSRLIRHLAKASKNPATPPSQPA